GRAVYGTGHDSRRGRARPRSPDTARVRGPQRKHLLRGGDHAEDPADRHARGVARNDREPAVGFTPRIRGHGIEREGPQPKGSTGSAGEEHRGTAEGAGEAPRPGGTAREAPAEREDGGAAVRADRSRR